MTNPRTYPQQRAELPKRVHDYLYGCDPVAACGVCAALATELAEAREATEYGKAYDAAAEIRNHPHPVKRNR
ncbi:MULTISPECIES: hypothetical protein [unclassified Streptomyces]|uniref:Uncharacterized protein n=1 Tax=Streptomyces sp. NBC_00060 TaxID=2975636 RepID=A0AAU2H4C7_9ACTN